MPRRHRHRKMRGGFLDSITSTLSGWGTSISDSASSAYNKAKGAVTGDSSSSSYIPTTTTDMSTTSYGGRKHRVGCKCRTCKTRKHMKGGFTDNTPTTGLAAHAAPFSGATAQPLTIVGGRTRRRGRKGGFLGEVINQAVVPVALLGMQQTYRRKRSGGRTRKHRRH